MEKVAFQKVISDQTSKYSKIRKDEYLPFGLYTIIDQGQQFIGGYTNSEDLIEKSNLPAIVFGDHTRILKYVDFPFTIGADGVKVLSVNKEIADTKYVYYFLKSLKLPEAGYSRHFKFLKTFEIPLPKLEDQIRIADILSKAESLIRQRKESLRLLDEFLKSTFLEMFGDFSSARNVKLKEICSKITDGTHDTPERLTEGIKFITGKHIRPFVVDYQNSDYVSKEVHLEIFKRCNPELNDILYTNIGVNLGTAALNTVDYEFSMKNVALLKPLDKVVNPQYLVYALNDQEQKTKILGLASSGGAQKFLSLTQIRSISLPLPPLEIQNQFAAVVEKAKILRFNLQQSLQELDTLYESLSQRAFKGELDLKEETLAMAAEPKEAYQKAGKLNARARK